MEYLNENVYKLIITIVKNGKAFYTHQQHNNHNWVCTLNRFSLGLSLKQNQLSKERKPILNNEIIFTCVF